MQVFESLRDQLGTKITYDFGLRCIKNILLHSNDYIMRIAGNVKGTIPEKVDAK